MLAFLDPSNGWNSFCGTPLTGGESTDFHTHLRLLGESHDHEIRLLQERFAQELLTVQEENVSLRRTLQSFLVEEWDSSIESVAKGLAAGGQDNGVSLQRAMARDQSGSSLCQLEESGRKVAREAEGIDMERQGSVVAASVTGGAPVAVTSVTWNAPVISLPLSSSEPLGMKDVDIRSALENYDSVESVFDSDLDCSIPDDVVPMERASPVELPRGPLGSIAIAPHIVERLSNSIDSARAQLCGSHSTSGIFWQSLKSVGSETSTHKSSEFMVSVTARAETNWRQLGMAVLAADQLEGARLHQTWHSCAGHIKGVLTGRTSEGFSNANSAGNRNSKLLYGAIATKQTEKTMIGSGGQQITTFRVSRLSLVRKPIRLSQSGRLTEPCIQRVTVMKPGCRLRWFWDFLCILWCTHDAFMFPLQLFNALNSDNYQFKVTLMMAIFWTIDICMSTSTGYYTKEGNVEMKRKRILITYARTWLPLDLPVVLVDWILLFMPTSGLSTLSYVARIVRMARLLRVIKLIPKVWDFVGQINSENIYSLAQLLWYICLIILFNHYIACGLYGTWPWIGEGITFADGYLKSLHWALAHSCLGNMDVEPQSIFERLWTCIVLVLSMIIFSTFLSSITNTIAHLRTLRQERLRQEQMVRAFFADNNISRELAAQVWNFIWRSQRREKARTRESEVQFFRNLPIQIRVEIKLETFLPFLVHHPLFCRLNETAPEMIVTLCDRGVEQTVLHAQQALSWPGPGGEVSRMIFVAGGSIVYMPFYDPSNSFEVHRNHWACEETLWSSSAQLTGPFLGGRQGSDLMLIVPEQFREISRSFTSSHPLLVTYAAVFIERFNTACLDEEYTNLLFNGVFEVNSLLATAESESGNSNARFSFDTKKKIMKTLSTKI